MIALKFRGKNFILGALTLSAIALGTFSVVLIKRTEVLLKSFEDVRREGNVYVSPGPYGGIYQVNERYQDVKYFSKWVVRQLYMYSDEGLRKQYLQVQPFLSPELLVTADHHYLSLIQRENGVNSHVAIDHSKIEVDEVPAKERHRQGEKDYFVIIYADVQKVRSKVMQQPSSLQITIRLKPVTITNSNPYGFIILNYKEQKQAKMESST
ncbi:MAG: hypothetical protein OSB62_08765 [Alphaproteobacteria bacterium]|nr:hypothetical protein [Alphaproteobacteria bacterium]